MTPITSMAPKLILHFDVNKTLINSDSVTGKSASEVLINQLAEDTCYRWDSSHPKMSYKAYVDSVLVPGASSDLEIKRKRRELVFQFLETAKSYPEITRDVQDRYKQLMEKSTNGVFPSFVKLVEKLKENQFLFIIILRSFGNDLCAVEKEIFEKTGLSFSARGAFKKGVLHLEGKENRTIEKAGDIFTYFSSLKENVSIQDSYEDWNGNHEKAEFGKKFVFEGKAPDRKVANLSLFFDDNLTGHPCEDIVAPFTQEGDFVSTDNIIGKILFPVHLGQAILNENYYIELVNHALKQNGFSVEIPKHG